MREGLGNTANSATFDFTMYAKDSFFTLSLWGQIGLTALSLILFCVTVAAVYKLTRITPIVLALPIAVATFFIFVCVSPQIYYFYYMALFEHLPLQNVVQAFPSPAQIFNLMIFRSDVTSSAHSLGVLAWALVLAAVWPGRPMSSSA